MCDCESPEFAEFKAKRAPMKVVVEKSKKPLSLDDIVEEALGDLDGVTGDSIKSRVFGMSDAAPEEQQEPDGDEAPSAENETGEEELPEDLKAKLLQLLSE